MEIKKCVKLSREREVGIDSQTARKICISTYLTITNQATAILSTEEKRREMQVSLLNMFSV